MEGVPPHLNAKEIANAMIKVGGVREVHDLHIWTITSGRDALSAHIIVSVRGGSGWLDSLGHSLSGAWRVADYAAVSRVVRLS